MIRQAAVLKRACEYGMDRRKAWSVMRELAVVEGALARLSISPEERRAWMHRFQLSEGTELTTRAAFRDVVSALVESLVPEPAGAVEALLETLPERFALSMCSTIEVALVYLVGGHEVYPTLSLAEAISRMIIESWPTLVSRTPVFEPVFKICANDPQLFMDIATQSSHVFFFHGGRATHRRSGSQASSIHYEDYPVLVLEPLFIGFYTGLLDHLRTPRDVRFEVLSPREGLLELCWDN